MMHPDQSRTCTCMYLWRTGSFTGNLAPASLNCGGTGAQQHKAGFCNIGTGTRSATYATIPYQQQDIGTRRIGMKDYLVGKRPHHKPESISVNLT